MSAFVTELDNEEESEQDGENWEEGERASDDDFNPSVLPVVAKRETVGSLDAAVGNTYQTAQHSWDCLS